MTLFHESQGGEVVSKITGRAVVRICVDELTTEEAYCATQAVIRALDAEFPEAGKAQWGQVNLPKGATEGEACRGASGMGDGPVHGWEPPAEDVRQLGYRCLALVEVEWAENLDRSRSWARPDDHWMLCIGEGLRGTHGFLPLPDQETAEKVQSPEDRSC